MTYDFDSVTDRRGSGSLKWDVGEQELPMWVADMDFKTAPAIEKAIVARAAHGIYGYTDIPTAWYTAYIHWWQERHAFTMQKDWLLFCTGVIPAVSTAVRRLTAPAEKVAVMTPVYNIFFNSIRNNGRIAAECPLHYDGERYTLSLDELEQVLADPQVTLLLLCNPHNPIGKIWDRDTLAAIGALCVKHAVTVLSDEIHCDLTAPQSSYIPFASVSPACRDNSVTCLAPTKTFNIAGLQTAAVSIPNPVLRHKMWRALNNDEVAEPNVFAVTAAIAAFTEGAPWLDALRVYIAENRAYAADFIRREIPSLKAVDADATYLMWLCCRSLTADSEALAACIRSETGLYLSAGNAYSGDGNAFLRMNIACPRSTLEDGLQRLKRGIAAFSEKHAVQSAR